MERKVKKEIRAVLKELGASMSSKGCNYIVEIVYEGVVDDRAIVSGSKIYNHYATVFGDTYSRTERALRTVRDTCISKSVNTQKFREVFGDLGVEGKITLYEFLESIRLYVLYETEAIEC